MSERNFIGKQLLNIKERIANQVESSISTHGKEKDSQNISVNTGEKQSEKKIRDTAKRSILLGQKLTNEAVKDAMCTSILDKSYLKALNAKKEDYLKTKQVVEKMLKDTLTILKGKVNGAEEETRKYLDSADFIRKLSEEISNIRESKWDVADFSAELSEAGKIVERARLENIILNEKFDLKKMGDSHNNEKKEISVFDIVSLSFSQMFRLGFCFSLPIILGLILAALFISLTILIAMRAI